MTIDYKTGIVGLHIQNTKDTASLEISASLNSKPCHFYALPQPKRSYPFVSLTNIIVQLQSRGITVVTFEIHHQNRVLTLGFDKPPTNDDINVIHAAIASAVIAS